MKRNFNVIQINGIKGILLAVFLLGCLVAGFLTFPGWLCMNIWNYISGYFVDMPKMQLVHGVLLWCIFALSFYALNRGNFAISFGTPKPIMRNDERIKEILRQINEQNSSILNIDKNIKNNEQETSVNTENDDKMLNK